MKGRIRWWLLAVVLACSSTVHAGVTGRLVYLGLDPSSNQHGGNDDQRFQLAGNAVRWVGQNNDPTTAFVNGDSAFGSETGFLLATAGLTDLTEIPVQDLDTADLSGFEALYIGPRTMVADLVAAAANVLSFVQSGGGLVVEPNLFEPESWSWVPFADQIGHSGDENASSNDVTIVDRSHPVMQGLTSAGLSDWANSVHSVFSSPEAAEFDELAIDSGITGLAVIIARGGEPTGGCCFDDFSCEQVTGKECDSAGGTYQGDGTNCDDCPLPPTGACCFEEACQVLTESECAGAGGDYRGDGTNCDDNDGNGLADICEDGDCSGFPCGNGKVLICHVPPGNPDNAHTICISENAVPGHFANHKGDHCGPCEEDVRNAY